MRAVLPEDMEEPTITTMMTGETAYTTPWGMWVDTDRNCWLHPDYPAEPEPHGTVEMRVELRDDGYHVWRTGHRYSPRAEPGYVSPADTMYLPVVEIH